MQYRKKPVVIEAVQYNGSNDGEIIEFTGGIAKSMRIPFSPEAPDRDRFPETMNIPTLEGDHLASKGDFIIKGIKGEFYPCKPDIFEATYDKV